MNAATTAGHTWGWSVGQGNVAVAMPMIRLWCGGGTILLEPLEDPDDPSPSTKCCPELAKHLDISLGVDCHRPLVDVLEPKWSNDAMLEMATQAVHFTECNGLCRQCSGGCATPEDVVLRVHLTWQQKMCLVRKPDIVNWAAWIDFCKKYASNMNIFCSVVYGISKVKFGRLLEH